MSPVNASSLLSFSVTLHGWQAVSYLLAFLSPAPQIEGGLPLLWALPRSEACTLCYPSWLWCVSFLWMLCPFMGLPINKSSLVSIHLLDQDAVKHLTNAFSIWVHLAWSVSKQQFQQLMLKIKMETNLIKKRWFLLNSWYCALKSHLFFAPFFLFKFLNLFLCKCLGIELKLNRTGRRDLGKRQLKGYQWSMSEKSFRMSCGYTKWDHASLWIYETFN